MAGCWKSHVIKIQIRNRDSMCVVSFCFCVVKLDAYAIYLMPNIYIYIVSCTADTAHGGCEFGVT